MAGSIWQGLASAFIFCIVALIWMFGVNEMDKKKDEPNWNVITIGIVILGAIFVAGTFA